MEEQGKAGKNGEREKVRQQESKRRGRRMEEQGKAGKNGEREKVRQQESKRRRNKSAKDEE